MQVMYGYWIQFWSEPLETGHLGLGRFGRVPSIILEGKGPCHEKLKNIQSGIQASSSGRADERRKPPGATLQTAQHFTELALPLEETI